MERTGYRGTARGRGTGVRKLQDIVGDMIADGSFFFRAKIQPPLQCIVRDTHRAICIRNYITERFEVPLVSDSNSFTRASCDLLPRRGGAGGGPVIQRDSWPVYVSYLRRITFRVRNVCNTECFRTKQQDSFHRLGKCLQTAFGERWNVLQCSI